MGNNTRKDSGAVAEAKGDMQHTLKDKFEAIKRHIKAWQLPSSYRKNLPIRSRSRNEPSASDFYNENTAMQHDDEATATVGHPRAGQVLPNETEWERWRRETFGLVAGIADGALVKLADGYLTAAGVPQETKVLDVRVRTDTTGSNNIAFIIGFTFQTQEVKPLKICIRVPACGTRGKWTEKDGEVLRDYALTMKMIGEKAPKFPIPKIYGFDTTLDNPLGAPYIAMAFAEGQTLDHVWLDNSGPITMEQKRQRILQSLAEAMSELRRFRYSMMGSLKFKEDEKTEHIGDSYFANFGNTTRDSEFIANHLEDYVLEAQESSQEYLNEHLEVWRELKIKVLNERPNPAYLLEVRGMYSYLSAIIDLMPVAKDPKTGKENFVLVPPDFDIQNILVDNNGNITALIDWDRVESQPCFLGWASCPEFLKEDWDHDYKWPNSSRYQLSPEEFDRYRADYARYMKQACSGAEEECAITEKSALFGAVWRNIGRGDDDHRQLLEKILAIVCPRVLVRDHLIEVGKHGLDNALSNLGIKAKLEELFAVQ
ncbi:hypothetical protein K490DRAFT_62309 [Saccharata proteae CBS 121410]|uniref:Aminoglycoside phosphotransferase domain-containing protein n=1 Tax=Saccharata proteae CBS 121410 TaxID=1314787 RepID=A0A9P4I1T9_9PEZI|nr:hypothetical protein K490DRAFT_62309 [Saccharata proteae CBS 121410]